MSSNATGEIKLDLSNPEKIFTNKQLWDYCVSLNQKLFTTYDTLKEWESRTLYSRPVVKRDIRGLLAKIGEP